MSVRRQQTTETQPPRQRPISTKSLHRFPRSHRLRADNRGPPAIRVTLAGLKRAELAEVLTESELEALEFGDRERVTEIEKDHIRELPKVLPQLFVEAALRAQQARLITITEPESEVDSP